MNTVSRARKPLAEVSQSTLANSTSTQKQVTVEQYLEEQCNNIIKDLRLHGDELIQNIRNQHMEGVSMIKKLIVDATPANISISVLLKCVGGPHLGQKFKLEMNEGATEDVFKMGRSTGRNFKEHGVSLYKDKEISTTHARIEIRNGQVFLIDNRSTNGTQLNGVDAEPQTPLLLKTGDIITMGGCELEVNVINSETDVVSV